MGRRRPIVQGARALAIQLLLWAEGADEVVELEKRRVVAERHSKPAGQGQRQRGSDYAGYGEDSIHSRR